MAEMITVKRAVELSGYKDHHIRDLLRIGRVKGTKWGTVWQVDKASLLRYMREVQKLGDKRGAKPKD